MEFPITLLEALTWVRERYKPGSHFFGEPVDTLLDAIATGELVEREEGEE